MTNKESPEIDIISLSPISELRFRLNAGDSVTIELTDGIAFCHGWTLPQRTRLTFRDQSFPISTNNYGCSIKVSGNYISYYSAPFGDPMEQYPFIKEIIQSVDSVQPPTIFVVGSPSVGKTSLCKWLCNTILSSGNQRYPIYVNADPDQAPFCPPGCIGAIPVTSPINNFGFPFTDPIIYMYGTVRVEEKKAPLYIDQLKELLRHISERRKFVGSLDGGTVIDFPSVTSKCIFDILEKTITNLDAASVRVIVIGDDKLFNNIRRSMPAVKTHKIPMLPGIENLSKESRALIRSNEIRRYFYGDGNPDLLPQIYLLSKSNVQLYSLGYWSVLDESIMPIQTEMPDPKFPQPVPFGDRLIGLILAILPQETKSLLWKQTVIGFMHVVGLGEDEKQLSVLKPNPDPLPSNNIIVSQVKWNLQ